MDYTPEQIAAVLDYAVLKPWASIEDIKDGAAFCNKNKIGCYCVASANVRIAAEIHPNVASVIGFPHGNASPFAKIQEAMGAIENGAKELDVVINYGRYLGGDWRIIGEELAPLCTYAHHHGVLVKAILETCYMTTGEIFIACRRCINAEVDYVKTSTGFGRGGATVEMVATMIAAVKGTGIKVKASGGIKTYSDVVQYLDLGCKRLGTSRYQELLK